MGTHLAAVGSIGLTHYILHEGVPRLRHDRLAAQGLHQFHRCPGQSRVMDYSGTRFTTQEHGGKQSDDVIALDEVARLIEQETAIVVTVPGNAQISLVLSNGLNGGLAVLLDHRVRHAIREGAIRLVMNLDELEWQMRFEQINDCTCAAVASVHDDLELLEPGAIQIRQQMRDVFFPSIDLE